MSSIVPVVRHMLLCDDVRRNPTDPHKVTIYGVVSTIRPTAGEAAYPVRHTMSVYLALSDGRGSGQGQIVIRSGETGDVTFTGEEHTITFRSGPLEVLGVIFRITVCTFPQPGLYWVEFRYNGTVLAHQPLVLG